MSEASNPTNLIQNLTQLVEGLLQTHNDAHEASSDTALYLVEIVIRGRESATRVVEVYLDSDVGINLDECVTISRQLSEVLDELDLIKGKYTLNVSSPDITRPFVLKRQYVKNVGRMIEVTCTNETDQTVTVKGTITSASDTEICLERPKQSPITIQFEVIKQGKIVLPW